MTDLPEPVVPATSRWGSFCKSLQIGLPCISFPRAIVSGDLDLSYSLEMIISLNDTVSLISFGISIPMDEVPGMLSTTLKLVTDIVLARSFDKLII